MATVPLQQTPTEQIDTGGTPLFSATNIHATASTVSPFLNMTSTLMSGVGDFAANEGYGFFDKK